ncbi:MAG: FAS1-like dehydratase domain-containing protein, partial [Mycobacteriaceae bacterium]
MTNPADKVGTHYRVDDFYEVGREKIREYARSVQNNHRAHLEDEVAVGLGYDGLVAPLTFISIIG